MKITGISLGTVLALFSVWHLAQGQSIAPSQNVSPNFKGRLLAISDADMIAGAYANGELNKVNGIEDELLLVDGSGDSSNPMEPLHVSNSVISWPAILEWNPTNQLAYVAETRSVHKGDAQKMGNVFTDFPVGKKITVVDYTNAATPKIVQEKEVGENIQGVSINASGTLLVSGSTTIGKELVVMGLKEGLIESVQYFTHEDISTKDTGNGGIRTIEFHPTKNIIAANLNNTHLIFFKITDNNGTISLSQLGKTMEVAKRWSVGNWHPSGKYFILSDLRWGDGLGQITHGKGKLVSIGFDEGGNHTIIDKEKVGLSPEGFDISPDGNYAVTANMRRTWAPKKGFWFVPARKESSLSLVKINPDTGELTKVGKDYGFEGALPEDAVFDLENNTIAVAVYHDRNEEFPTEGWIDFWEVKDDELIKTEKQLKVARGVHNLLLIK
ncbi:hypothetical protein CLV81_3309 [Flagellimonas meridianipacifica]|uniref:Lactonase family protein with 7-bladed beta-propeller n=2 Tax=Flagellimonas meridianipacifica TaxID=1080225 RepID=A0A2T0MBM4_9FLAO|nr:hypothetical protein CLV81_3309 [Allomuricauda pacifica]